jgi:6-phospho-beta-glucosidase
VGLKLAVVGAGSSYTVELFAELTSGARRLDVDEVALYDPNAERLAFIAGVAQRILDGAGSTIRVAPSSDLERAVAGARFVIPQIRVGGLAARKRDESLPMELGLVGNETTGAGGFVCALRTVPVVVDIARVVERVAPDAWLLNLTNPAGIVTEALLTHTSVRTMGFCNIPTNTAEAIARIVGVEPAQVRLDSFGLNHLSWLRGAWVDGADTLGPLIDAASDPGAPIVGLLDPLMDREAFRALRLLPSWYTRYFYFTEAVLAADQATTETKADLDVRAEERLAHLMVTSGYDDEVRAILASKGGASYYVNVLQAIDAIVHDSREVIVVDVRNGGAITDLPSEACAEIPARVGAHGAEPLPVGALPLPVRGLIQSVKTYEQLTIEAALRGDERVALQALVANPLVGSYTKARPFLDRVLGNERAFLPRFHDGRTAPISGGPP